MSRATLNQCVLLMIHTLNDSAGNTSADWQLAESRWVLLCTDSLPSALLLLPSGTTTYSDCAQVTDRICTDVASHWFAVISVPVVDHEDLTFECNSAICYLLLSLSRVQCEMARQKPLHFRMFTVNHYKVSLQGTAIDCWILSHMQPGSMLPSMKLLEQLQVRACYLWHSYCRRLPTYGFAVCL